MKKGILISLALVLIGGFVYYFAIEAKDEETTEKNSSKVTDSTTKDTNDSSKTENNEKDDSENNDSASSNDTNRELKVEKELIMNFIKPFNESFDGNSINNLKDNDILKNCIKIIIKDNGFEKNNNVYTFKDDVIKKYALKYFNKDNFVYRGNLTGFTYDSKKREYRSTLEFDLFSEFPKKEFSYVNSKIVGDKINVEYLQTYEKNVVENNEFVGIRYKLIYDLKLEGKTYKIVNFEKIALQNNTPVFSKERIEAFLRPFNQSSGFNNPYTVADQNLFNSVIKTMVLDKAYEKENGNYVFKESDLTKYAKRYFNKNNYTMKKDNGNFKYNSANNTLTSALNFGFFDLYPVKSYTYKSATVSGKTIIVKYKELYDTSVVENGDYRGNENELEFKLVEEKDSFRIIDFKKTAINYKEKIDNQSVDNFLKPFLNTYLYDSFRKLSDEELFANVIKLMVYNNEFEKVNNNYHFRNSSITKYASSYFKTDNFTVRKQFEGFNYDKSKDSVYSTLEFGILDDLFNRETKFLTSKRLGNDIEAIYSQNYNVNDQNSGTVKKQAFMIRVVLTKKDSSYQIIDYAKKRND